MLSGIVTTMWLLLFVALWAWAWQPRLRKDFEAAARLAVDDGDDAIADKGMADNGGNRA